MSAQLRFEMRVPVTVVATEGGHLARCDLLDVAAEGSTSEEAVRQLVDALQLFVATCFEMGTLDRVLRDIGFTRVDSDEDDEDDDIDGGQLTVPISLVAHRERGAHRPC